jgi:cation diffusion facilitator CzcD-associated flavoprotein CzcO
MSSRLKEFTSGHSASDFDDIARVAWLKRATVLASLRRDCSIANAEPVIWNLPHLRPWEGEQRNMWKPTQQEGLWFHGGNLHQSRHYSQFLSFQLKARMEGIPTPVYGLQKAHHLS